MKFISIISNSLTLPEVTLCSTSCRNFFFSYQKPGKRYFYHKISKRSLFTVRQRSTLHISCQREWQLKRCYSALKLIISSLYTHWLDNNSSLLLSHQGMQQLLFTENKQHFSNINQLSWNQSWEYNQALVIIVWHRAPARNQTYQLQLGAFNS